MHHYDVALKLLLTQSSELVQSLSGAAVTAWPPVELPEFHNRRLDLLGELTDGSLFHMELQSSNDPDMPLRMAEYFLGIYRKYRRFPQQVVLYAGFDPLRMADRLAANGFSFQYRIVDARTLDGERLLASPQISDNVMAVLARLQNQRAAVKAVIEKIGQSDVADRRFYLQVLFVLAGLRGLENIIEEETKGMPFLIDILDNKVLGREFKRGLQEGREQGVQQGLQQGELAVLKRLLERRFGVLPDWAAEGLAKRSVAELEELAVRILDANSLEELLG